MNKPRNTSTAPPEDHLLGMMGGQTDYITGMESQGQAELVRSEPLPTECRDDEAMVALGFTFGEPYADDPLFRDATLPDGWEKKGSDHAMWSYVVDERGVERVAIFYKAAFYDRSAHMTLVAVGQHLATQFIYAESGKGGEPPWDVLTDDERAAFIEALRDYLRKAEEHPTIYGDRAPRVRAKLDAVTKPLP